jgi:capsular exopolysaccharide synthesis family protein
VQTSDQAARSSLSQAQIIDRATPPVKPSEPKVALLLGGGVLSALVLGVAAVALMEIVSTTFLTVTDVQALGLPLLGSTLNLAGSQLAKGGEDVKSPADFVVTKPLGIYAESFRALRGSLALGTGHDGRTIAIVSTLPGEGKTTSSLSLARIMAMAGERTLLIDTDLRRSGLTKIAGISAEVGLVEVLHGDVAVKDAIVPDVVENLAILPIAQTVFTPEDMFGSAAMPNLLAELRQYYDHIIVDTPPLLGVADARTIAAMVDQVVLFIRWNSTPRNAVLSGLEMLAHDQAHVMGAVLSMVNRSSEAYGGLYYSQKYAKYYKEDD